MHDAKHQANMASRAASTRVEVVIKMSYLVAFTIALLSPCCVATSRSLLVSSYADAPEGGQAAAPGPSPTLTTRTPWLEPAVLQPPTEAAAAAELVQSPQPAVVAEAPAPLKDNGHVKSKHHEKAPPPPKQHAKAPPKHHGHGHHAPPADLTPPAPPPESYNGQPPVAPTPSQDDPAWPFPWPRPGNQWPPLPPFHPPPFPAWPHPGNKWPPLPPFHPPPTPAWPNPGNKWPPLPPFHPPPIPAWPHPGNKWPPLPPFPFHPPPFPAWPQPEPGKQWPPLPPFPFHPPPMPAWPHPGANQWPPAPSFHGNDVPVTTQNPKELEAHASTLPPPVTSHS